MTREALIELVRGVLGDHAVLAAIARTQQLAAVEDVLLARAPANPAVISEVDGTLRIVNGRVELETKWGREPIAVDPARLIVTDGREIEAGQLLTEGSVALADTMRVFGQRATMERIASALQPLLDVSHEVACEVATPMVMLIEVIGLEGRPLGVRMTASCFEAAIEAIGNEPMIRGEVRVVGYDVLATHRDPPHDMFAKQRAAEQAQYEAEEARRAARAAEIAVLEQRALAGDRVALQHLVLACMEPDTIPDAPGPDATMMVCREARPGTFKLTRANDGTWQLDCLTTHSHFRNPTTVAAVIAERPALEQFLALPAGSSVTFKDFLELRTRRERFPTIGSFVHRRMAQTREGPLVLDDELREIVLRGDVATAVTAIGERMLIPSWRAKELVITERPKWQPTADLDRDVLAIFDTGGIIPAIKHYRDVSKAGLADAKSYVEQLVATRSS